MLSDNNFYVTTQWTGDLKWLLSEIGDGSLIIGTHYGHRDTATEVLALKRMSEDANIPAAAVTRMLEENPGRPYGIH